MRSKTVMALMAVIYAALGAGTIVTFTAFGIFHAVPWLFMATMIAIPYVTNRHEKQQFMAWKDEYGSGIEAIDNDHRQLIDLINRFEAAARYKEDELFEKNALSELANYTQHHFSCEEELMEKHEYPELAQHKAQHAAMIEKVNTFLACYKESDQEEIIEEIAAYLKYWLANHILNVDKKAAVFLSEAGVRP